MVQRCYQKVSPAPMIYADGSAKDHKSRMIFYECINFLADRPAI